MVVSKPYYRCYRPYLNGKSLRYLGDKKNVEFLNDYIRKPKMLYSRLETIIE